jgi:hypothetical protein
MQYASPKLFQMSMDASTFLIDEFDDDTQSLLYAKHVVEPSERKMFSLYSDDLYIYAPLLLATARSPRLGDIIAPSNANRAVKTGLEDYLKQIPSLSFAEFYRRCAALLIGAANYFVRNDGKPFYQVDVTRNGKILARKTDQYEPGYAGSEDQQCVLSRVAVQVLSGLFHLRDTVRVSYSDARLAHELGAKYPLFISEMKNAETKAQATIDLLHAYQGLGTRAVLPKYLYVHPETKRNNDLEQDLLPTMVYLNELIHNKPEKVRSNLIEILAVAKMHHGKELPDLFWSCEGYYYARHGSVIEASRKLTDVLKWIKKN